mgnify:CR=1 FL=1
MDYKKQEGKMRKFIKLSLFLAANLKIDDKSAKRLSTVFGDLVFNKLLAKFENLCSQKQGQLIGQAYFINKDYTKEKYLEIENKLKKLVG